MIRIVPSENESGSWSRLVSCTLPELQARYGKGYNAMPLLHRAFHYPGFYDDFGPDDKLIEFKKQGIEYSAHRSLSDPIQIMRTF
jgi:hypothetical protein